MSTTENQICLECKYQHYTSGECFKTSLCKLAIEQLQTQLAEKEAENEKLRLFVRNLISPIECCRIAGCGNITKIRAIVKSIEQALGTEKGSR